LSGEIIRVSSRRLLLFKNRTSFFERRRRGIFVEPPAQKIRKLHWSGIFPGRCRSDGALNLQTPQLQICRAHGAKTPARNLVLRGSLISRLKLTANHANYANGQLLPCQSGAEATTVQTLRAGRTLSNLAKFPDCGAFAATFILAFRQQKIQINA
jgi:hypothetical protein